MPLLIETYLKEIPGKGISVISSEDIEEGIIAYRDDLNFDKLISEIEVNNMPEVQKKFIHKYCSFENGYYYLCMDNSRFLNHSFNPTLKWDNVNKVYKTSRNIKAGEELTSNYTEFDEFSKNGDFGFSIIE